MISSDLGIVTAYAEAVSKGYTGTREEFGQMLADFSKSEKKVADDRAAVENAKKDVDDTVEAFDSHVTEKTAEATQAITDHTDAEKANATVAVSESKDAATSAIVEAKTNATNEIASAKDSATAEITKKGADTLAAIPEDYTALTKKVDDVKKNLGDGSLSFAVNADDGGLDVTYTP